MANAGPNTNESQFFLNYHSYRLVGVNHTIFGEVVSKDDLSG